MDIVKAFFIAFLPLAVLTFVVAYISYRNGEVTPEQDEKDEWDMSGQFDDDRPSNNYLHQKWMSFGGGYYGLMAFLTLIYIEGLELFGLYQIRDQLPELIAALDRDAVIDIFTDQIMNMVDAFVWFQFWPDIIRMGNGWTWLGLSYAGYSVGRWLALRVLK